MMYYELNLEVGYPTVDEALLLLKNEVNRRKAEKAKIMLVIHGYGSSGKGGLIRIKARQWLMAQVKNAKIKAVINGEDFNIFNAKALELKNKYCELEPLIKVCNHGVTVVEL